MPQRAAQWDELFTPVIYEFFEIGFNLRPLLMPTLYNEQSTMLESENRVGIGGISPDTWELYSKSGRPGELDFNKGYTKTFTQAEFPVRLELEKKLLKFDQFNKMGTTRARRMGVSANQFVELKAASTFNNAFSGSFLGPDSVALCSSAHPHSPAASGTTQSNTGTSAISESVISTTRTAMMKFTDDQGNPLGITPDTILVPPDLHDTALKAAGSPQEPSTGNNAINPQNGRFNVVPWHYLTDTNNWFMIDSVQMRESLEWLWSETLADNLMVVQETTTHVTWEGKLMFDYGFSDWRWVYGHNVT